MNRRPGRAVNPIGIVYDSELPESYSVLEVKSCEFDSCWRNFLRRRGTTDKYCRQHKQRLAELEDAGMLDGTRMWQKRATLDRAKAQLDELIH